MGECGTRTLFASTSEGGLNTTSKVSVFASAALGAAACDAADTDTTPATTAAVITTMVNTDLRIVPPWRNSARLTARPARPRALTSGSAGAAGRHAEAGRSFSVARPHLSLG